MVVALRSEGILCGEQGGMDLARDDTPKTKKATHGKKLGWGHSATKTRVAREHHRVEAVEVRKSAQLG
jgi:hypothetical protein